MIEQVGGVDIVVAPIGGVGMISGTFLILSTPAPETRIIAAEPAQADDVPDTIADGLKVPLKELTWHFVSNHATDILTASEQEIIDAMKITWKYLRIVVEPSSVMLLAIILKNMDL